MAYKGRRQDQYVPNEWVNGDVITAEKLNHMEDGISTGGGIYTYGEAALFDGEVTTVSDGAPYAGGEITLQGELPKTDIHVTFNGQDYTLPHGIHEGNGDYWGELGDNGPSFTNYPVFVAEDGIYTQEEGTYSLKIYEIVGKFTVNDGFKSALVNILIATLDPDTYKLNKTFKEIKDANDTGLVLIKSLKNQVANNTEVIVNVNVNDDDLGLVSVGYDIGSGKVGTFYYSAASINSYPFIQNS